MKSIKELEQLSRDARQAASGIDYEYRMALLQSIEARLGKKWSPQAGRLLPTVTMLKALHVFLDQLT